MNDDELDALIHSARPVSGRRDMELTDRALRELDGLHALQAEPMRTTTPHHTHPGGDAAPTTSDRRTGLPRTRPKVDATHPATEPRTRPHRASTKVDATYTATDHRTGSHRAHAKDKYARRSRPPSSPLIRGRKQMGLFLSVASVVLIAFIATMMFPGREPSNPLATLPLLRVQQGLQSSGEDKSDETDLQTSLLPPGAQETDVVPPWIGGSTASSPGAQESELEADTNGEDLPYQRTRGTEFESDTNESDPSRQSGQEDGGKSPTTDLIVVETWSFDASRTSDANTDGRGKEASREIGSLDASLASDANVGRREQDPSLGTGGPDTSVIPDSDTTADTASDKREQNPPGELGRLDPLAVSPINGSADNADTDAGVSTNAAGASVVLHLLTIERTAEGEQRITVTVGDTIDSVTGARTPVSEEEWNFLIQGVRPLTETQRSSVSEDESSVLTHQSDSFSTPLVFDTDAPVDPLTIEEFLRTGCPPAGEIHGLEGIAAVRCVLLEQRLDSEQISALLTYLSTVPDFEPVGLTSDRLDREAFAYRGRSPQNPDYENYLLVSPDEPRILGIETVYVGDNRPDLPSPAVVEYHAWLTP